MTQTLHSSAKLALVCSVIMLLAAASYALELGESTSLGLNGLFASPQWAPNGQGLAVAGPNYQGLYVTDLYGNVKTISEEPMAGWRFSWSPDGQGLAYRTRDEIGMGMQLNVAGLDGESRQISPTLNDLFPPTWDKDGVTYRSGDELVTVDGEGNTVRVTSLSQGRGVLARAASVAGSMMMGQITGGTFTALSLLLPSQTTGGSKSEPGVFTDPDNQIWIVDENGNRKKLLDIEEEPGYFDPVQGGAGDYAVCGLSGNLYVADPENGGVVELGTGANPSWSPDGKYLVFERTTDDGHEITSSELWVASADGSVLQQLTNSSAIETQPSWSPDGNWIAYVVDGVVHLAPIKQ